MYLTLKLKFLVIKLEKMGGCVTSKDELEKMTVRNKAALGKLQLELNSEEAIPLSKGGILIKTKIGRIMNH